MKVKRMVACVLMAATSAAMAAQVTTSTEKDYVKAYEEAVESEKHPGGFDFSLSVLSLKHNRHESTFECFSGGLSVGFIHGIDEPQNVSLNMGRSLEVGWTDVLGLAYNINPQNALSVGFGLLWRNYRMTGHYRFLPATDGLVAVAPYPEGANPHYSRLHTLHMTLPLHYIHRFPNGINLALGPEFAFNAGGNKHTRTVKTRYTLDGQKFKDMHRDVHIQNCLTNITACVTWKQLGFYARYTPSPAFDTDFGPRFQSISVGLMFFGF